MESQLEGRFIEFFKSIQGEGKYAGAMQVFVRFFECNMHCVWCDTPHSIGDTTRRYKTLTLADVYERILNLWSGCHSVTLTGGEPLLQAEFCRAIAKELREKDIPIHLETNGICPNELEQVIDAIDVISMDLKLPSSTQCRSYWQEHLEFLKIAHKHQVELFIKTVISKDTDMTDIHEAVKIVHDVDPGVLFILQPNTFDLGQGVMKRCQEMQEFAAQHLKHVRILPQMHKIMKVR